MEVRLDQNIFVNNSTKQRKSTISAPNLAPLKKDTVSFMGSGALLKKTDFDGIDFGVIEKYKAPMEKFKSKDDFQNWCKNEIKSNIINKDFGGRQEETKIQRKAMLKEWSDYVLKDNSGYNNATKLLILDSITKELKPNNDNLPPVLNRGVLADCVQEIDDNLKTNKKYSFNFNKMYQTKLANYYSEDTNTGETETKWIKIPSKKHDPENFDSNVDRLKVLSHKSWCTKSYNARPYLAKGDFHVYLVNGQPKVGIRLVGNKVQEIQGEKNDSYIPLNYFDEISDYLEKNDLKISKDARYQIKDAKETKKQVNKIKKDLEIPIKNNNIGEILNYFGIESIKDEDGFLTISEYKQPTENITFENLGIKENDLFKKIKQINGTANFIGSNITSTGALESVAGFLYLDHKRYGSVIYPNLTRVENDIVGRNNQKNELIKQLSYYSKNDLYTQRKNLIQFAKSVNYNPEEIFFALGIDVKKDKDGFLTISKYCQPSRFITFKDIGVDEEKMLKKIKCIEGNASFENSTLKSLHSVESIGGYLVLGENIEDLGNLKGVGGDFCDIQSNIKTLGKVDSIGGDLTLGENIEDLGNLNFVGGDAKFDYTKKLRSLGNLKRVGGNLWLKESKVSDLGDLRHIGGDLWLNNLVTDVSKLKFVGEYIYHKPSPLKSRDFSHIERNHNPLFYLWDKIWYCSRED